MISFKSSILFWKISEKINIGYFHWILKYFYIRTLQTTILSEQTVLIKVICCSVCPFTNQATASEGRRAVPLGNPTFSSSGTAPPPLTVRTVGGSVHESSKADERKWVSGKWRSWSVQNCCMGWGVQANSTKWHQLKLVPVSARAVAAIAKKSPSGLFSSGDLLHHSLSSSLETSRGCVTAGTTTLREKTA